MNDGRKRNSVIFASLFLFSISLVILFLINSCADDLSPYEKLVVREKNSGERHDSVFMGVYLEMPMQQFYDHCFELNQRGVFYKNPGSVDVRYTFEDEFSSPVVFVFFPEGGHQSIQKVKGQMFYKNWAPFAKKFAAEYLQEELKEKMESWYPGNSFLRVPHPHGYWPYSYVKVDGNRKIHLFRSFNDGKVEVVFENLFYRKTE